MQRACLACGRTDTMVGKRLGARSVWRDKSAVGRQGDGWAPVSVTLYISSSSFSISSGMMGIVIGINS